MSLVAGLCRMVNDMNCMHLESVKTTGASCNCEYRALTEFPECSMSAFCLFWLLKFISALNCLVSIFCLLILGLPVNPFVARLKSPLFKYRDFFKYTFPL